MANNRNPWNGVPVAGLNNNVNVNAGMQNPQKYNDPRRGRPSSAGPQKVDAFISKNGTIDPITMKTALIQAKTRDLFLKYATELITLPNHVGKTIVQDVDIQVLDERNINDQGIDRFGNVIENGNLYGASLDILKFNKNLPILGEMNYRVNRIGFSRSYFEATLAHFGIFFEYTKEALLRDSDPFLKQKMFVKALVACQDIMSKMAQRDLIDMANTVVYAGNAVIDQQMGNGCIINESHFQALDTLFNKIGVRAEVSMVTGSNKIGTTTLNNCRILITSPEVTNYLRTLRDINGNLLFKSKETYASAGTLVDKDHEEGAIHNFRILSTPSMLCSKGAGATIDEDITVDNIKSLVQNTYGRADIHYLICINKGAFKTLSFSPMKTADNSNYKVKNIGDEKFRLPIEILEELPGKVSPAYPYGGPGLISIQWYYGMVPMNPNAIGLIKTCLPRFNTNVRNF